MEIQTDEGQGVEAIDNLPQGDIAQNEPEANDDGDAAEGDQQPKTEISESERLRKDLQKQDRRFARLTAQKYQMQRELQELREFRERYEKESAKTADPRPEPKADESFEDYQERMARWVVRQEGQGKAPAQAPSRVPQEEAAWHGQAQQATLGQARELAQHIEDFAETWQSHGPILDAMPYEIEKAFYQHSAHPALAIYVLAKEGVLADVASLPPQQAAAYIQQATQIGVQNIKSWAKSSKPQPTGAPKPLAPNKGTASGKADDAMSGSELLKKYKV